jgi:hypothetical protein
MDASSIWYVLILALRTYHSSGNSSRLHAYTIIVLRFVFYVYLVAMVFHKLFNQLSFDVKREPVQPESYSSPVQTL